MGVLDIFRPLRKSSVQSWKELGAYQSTFSVFGSDIYNSSVVRSCVRPLAEYSAKARAVCSDERIERMLNNRPNMYMNGTAFIKKVRTRLEILNTSFIYLERNDRNMIVGAYPVPYSYFEAVEYLNGLFIKFYFTGRVDTLTLPWEDLVVLRKDYNQSDIAGDSNEAIVGTLQLITTVDEGLANSIKATANLRGILKSTKAMLSPESIKKQKDEFVRDYLNLENSGGIASLDSTQEFIPINMNPSTASSDQRKDAREDIYRYFNVNDDFVMSNMKTEQLENLYRLRIEPFLIDLSRELSSKFFPDKAGAYKKNRIVYMTDQGEFMTMTQKLELFNKVVLYGGMTINEWRLLLGYEGIEGGDTPIRRLDADYINGDGNPREGNGSIGSSTVEE